MGCCSCIENNQSLKITNYTSRSIEHGPGVILYLPWANVEIINKINLTAEQYLKITFLTPQNHGDLIEHVPGPCIYEQEDGYAIVEGPLKKIELDGSEYVICSDPKTGHRHVVEGPVMYMPVPYEIVGQKQRKVSLMNNQFVRVSDISTGIMRIVSGPLTFALGAFEKSFEIQNKYELSTTQYLICTDGKTGEKTVVGGPCLYVPKIFEQVSGIIEKVSLKNNQYCHLKDCLTGKVTMVEGPRVFALTAFEETSKVFDTISLNFSQYVMIQHSITGVIKLEKGPARVQLVPFEEFIKDLDGKIVRNALTVDANNCIHIRDIVSGKEELITDNQLFFPSSPNIQIIGLKPLIKLASYERMVIMDRESNLIFKSGENSPGFFLPPFCKIMSQYWSEGNKSKNIQGKKEISVFDCRFNDEDFTFNVRTNDNVEITMSVNIYWKIKDFEKMINSTNDPPQDICNQIRSQILNISSKMTTQELMEYTSSDFVTRLHDEDIEFWHTRGMQIIRINITEKKCTDHEVDSTYRSIIEQKITRVKNLEAQRGVNDNKLSEIEGNILLETENFKLLERKMANVKMENITHGKAEGERIHMFFEGLGKNLSTDDKMNIFLELQRTDRIKMVTSKVDHLYVTPDQVDFQIHKIEDIDDNDKKSIKQKR